jgi:protein TonB
MNKAGFPSASRIRLTSFALVAVLHLMLLFFVVFHLETLITPPEPVAGVMKLVDLEEELPPPPLRPPPDMPQTNTDEAIAETMIETDEPPPPVTAPYQPYTAPEEIDYLPQHRISQVPVLPEDEIRRATVYPPIALRSNIEGMVYLELFIDRLGNVRDVRILRENPPNRGFGEAAVNAFRNIRGNPAEANGLPVAVRYRYNISFTLK